jgi:hypothetical protein
VQDSNNIYIQQDAYLSVGSTTGTSIFDSNGIGTFGGEYSGNNFVLKFYPDSSITSQIKISSFNLCMYTTLDNVNIPPDLIYGTVSESVKVNFYNAINGDRINRTDFDLTSNGIPIFAKTFDPSNTLQLNASTGTFTLPNHFFRNREQLVYTPKSTFLGVGASSIGYKSPTGGIGILPSSVFAINITENTFQISTTRTGTAVTFTSIGQGNAHQLEMYKKNEKALYTP